MLEILPLLFDMCKVPVQLRGLLADMGQYFRWLHDFLGNLDKSFIWVVNGDVSFVGHKTFYVG